MMLGRSLPLGSTLLEHLLTHVAGVRLYLTDRRLAPNREQIVTGTEDDLRGKLVYAWREGERSTADDLRQSRVTSSVLKDVR